MSNKTNNTKYSKQNPKENDILKNSLIKNTKVNVNIINKDSFEYQFIRDSNNKAELDKQNLKGKIHKISNKKIDIINKKQFHLDFSKIKEKEESELNFVEFSNRGPYNLQNINNKEKKNPNKNKKKISNNIDYFKSSINKNNNNLKKNIEKYNYYPGIFEDHEELINNCIYCISGRAFNFLYKNKEKKQCKKILEKIYKNCKIFYDMSSLDKSLVIDYYREFPDNCVCEIADTQSDFDSIITSNIGISLKAPKNRNTMLCHFYSADLNILSIKRIIREGRAVSENIMLLKISSIFYTMILNSYIICCFIRKVEIINSQLNFLELCYLIMCISSFIAKYDNFTTSNPLIQNKKLYICHYATQIIGIFVIKFISTFFQCQFFIGNEVSIEEGKIGNIYCSYYFIFCIEQLISTIFLFNFISFYRKSPFTNYFFIFFNLLLFTYFLVLELLNSSNYQYDIFKITIYEFLDELSDSFADNNKMKSILICLLDLVISITYSRIIYYFFDILAHRNIK